MNCNVESRTGTVSAFNGPAPEVRVFADAAEEAAGMRGQMLDERMRTELGSYQHHALGQGSRVPGRRGNGLRRCEVPPPLERIGAVADEADLEEDYDTERQLLYVACTRARDRLMVSGIDPTSKFLDNLAFDDQL